MKQLLIIGDSFAADWSSSSPIKGWPNQLAEHYDTTNLAQAGCGQYKIFKQLHSVDYRAYDRIIVWHTSPYRVHVLDNPIHAQDSFHSNADLIYADVEFHSRNNIKLQPLVDWFVDGFDLEYAEFIYGLICDRILRDLEGFHGKIIHCVCQPKVYEALQTQDNFFNFYHLWSPDTVVSKSNHFDQANNNKIFRMIQNCL